MARMGLRGMLAEGADSSRVLHFDRREGAAVSRSWPLILVEWTEGRSRIGARSRPRPHGTPCVKQDGMDRHAPPVLVTIEAGSSVRATGAGARARTRALTLIGVSSGPPEPLERGLPSFAAPEDEEFSETFLGLGSTLGTNTRRSTAVDVRGASGETEDMDLEARITLTMPFTDDGAEMVAPEVEPASRVVARAVEAAPLPVLAFGMGETFGDVLQSAMAL